MTTKEALIQIKSMLSKFSDNTKQNFELVEDKLADGTIVYYDLSTKEIYVAGEGGEKVPAPVGEHELQTGEIVIVAEEGKISEIKKKEDEPEIEVEVESAEVPAEKTDAEKEEMKKDIEKMKKDYEEMKKKVDEMSANFETLLKSQKMSIDIIEDLAKEPSAKPIQKPNTFHQQLKSEKEIKFQKLQQVFADRKK
jgi:hypothetical protein